MIHAGFMNRGTARAVRFLCCAMVVLAVVGAGCHSPVRPRTRYITGVVRYPDGEAVNTAKVSVGYGPISTYSDTVGRYSIAVPPDSNSVTLNARDGYEPGRGYVVTHFGTVRIAVGRYGAVKDIILDHITPI